MAEKYKVAKRGLVSPETLRFADGRSAVFSAEAPEHVLDLEEREAAYLSASGHEVEKMVVARKKVKRESVEPDPEPVKEEKENNDGA